MTNDRDHVGCVIRMFLAGLISLIVQSTRISAQVPDSLLLTTTLERFTEITEEEPDYQSISEASTGNRQRTIPLTLVNEKNLRRLGFLTDKQVKSILDYITLTGPILSVYELRLVEGLDTSAIRLLLPYLVQGKPDAGLPVSAGNLLRKGRHEILLFYGQGLEKKKGYLNHSYAGSMSKELFRYSYLFSNRVKAALSAEKDPGEEFFGPTQDLGMDYYAGYVSLMNTGKLESLTIGNFTAGFGQGLVVGTGSRLGSVVGFNCPLRISQGIKGSSSVFEGSYQRGIGAALNLGRLTLSAFYSRHKRDAVAVEVDSSDLETTIISSFQTSGYHRTEGEIEARNKLTEAFYGANITYTGTFYRIGVTGMHAGWSAAVEPAPKPYNLWYFRGTSLPAAGADMVVRLRYISLFGEAGTTFNGAWAWIAGVAAETAPGVTFSITARSYDPAYLNLFSNAFGQSSRTSNERGCLVNVNARLLRDFNLAAFADIFHRPWLSYRINDPSNGLEAGFLGSFTGIPGMLITTRVMYREDERNPDPVPLKLVSAGRFSILSLRLQADWQPGLPVSLKTQIEIKKGLTGFSGVSTAFMAGQELQAGLWKSRLKVAFRYALFDIPCQDLSIYSYEPDVSGSFSVPGYDGRGIRFMVMATGRITRHLSWWMKYGISWYENKKTIGSGLEEIPGNVRSEVKVQVVGIL